MRFERHARMRFISSKSTLINFQQGWKNKPQVAMKLPDFCLTPLKSICFQSCCIHRQIHPLGCLGSQGLKRLSVQTPNVRLRQKRCTSVLVYVVLTWAPLTTFQIALPTTAHTRYKVRFRPHSRAKSPPFSSFSHLCRVAFESVILNEFLDFGSNSRQNSCFFCHVMNTFCVWFIQGIYFQY